MRDERFRDLQRRASTEGESGAVALIQARLRTGALTLEQVELAAYLGSEAAREAVGFDLDEEADLEEFVWGLCDWGPWIQERACLEALRALSEAWPAVRPLSRARELLEELLAGAELDHAALEAAMQALEEMTGGPPNDWVSWNVELAAGAGAASEALAWHGGAGDALERSQMAVRALEGMAKGLPGGGSELVERLEARLAGALLEEPVTELERSDLRAQLRLADYEERKAAAPGQVRRLDERGWEYLQGQPFGDDAQALAEAGRRPSDCQGVSAHWRVGGDVVFLVVLAHLDAGAGGRTGFGFTYQGFERVEVQTWIPAEFVDRGWFEAAMLAWSCLRGTVRVRHERQQVGDHGLSIYLDDERTPPPGWLLVRWPEEVIALLMTCQVEALSLDHDLGDEGDERTGYTVLQWLEEQVATCGFEPPEEISVHSANASAAIKMRSAIASIERLAARAREG